MSRDEVRKAYLELIRSYIRVEDPSIINESSLLVNDLKVNSTRFVDIILETEDRFSISIDDKEMERFDRVGDAIDFICEKKKLAA
ncbi:MAG TPA: acyl carrier protein [Candidatus Dormibacteraeota bacterium]|jgi:NADH dehydrogenase (ubiquinone) 1 alpha/beta subcomplex 1|nr:acyl carrier protein [Candidatus Dormibacteraeota bacterium]